jgi:hypothetical protein
MGIIGWIMFASAQMMYCRRCRTNKLHEPWGAGGAVRPAMRLHKRLDNCKEYVLHYVRSILPRAPGGLSSVALSGHPNHRHLCPHQ